jgi:hypothetical protein
VPNAAIAPPSSSRRARLLFAVAVALVAAACLLPRIPQDPAYHRFADTRSFLGIPNALNVLSNLPLALAGLLGLSTLARQARRAGLVPEALPGYGVFFAGALLTGFGSASYHWAPGNETLVWDRLPMTLAFAGFLCSLVAERVSPRWGRALVAPLVIAGLASVIYWRATELRGEGDLRPYALMQFGPLVLLPLLLALYPAPSSPNPSRSARWLPAAFALYALAKVFEHYDADILALGGSVSGHTLKHLAAGLSVLCIERSLPRDSRVA